MSKEIIELLEKARSVARIAEPNKAGYECIEQHIDQVLTLLKQQPPAAIDKAQSKTSVEANKE